MYVAFFRSVTSYGLREVVYLYALVNRSLCSWSCQSSDSVRSKYSDECDVVSLIQARSCKVDIRYVSMERGVGVD